MPPLRTATAADLARWKRRGGSTDRGLGTAHHRRRRELMALLLTTGPRPCRICSQPLVHYLQCCRTTTHHERCRRCRLDLGHGTFRALGGDGSDCDLEHAWHNRAAGARLTNARRRAAPLRTRHDLPRW